MALRDHPLAKRWGTMIQRCTNPNMRGYKNYGGRGITVCERWRSLANFIEDMGECPPGHSLDRIDPNGPYSPENCRWATFSEQLSNQRFRFTTGHVDCPYRRWRFTHTLNGVVYRQSYDSYEEAVEAQSDYQFERMMHVLLGYKPPKPR